MKKLTKLVDWSVHVSPRVTQEGSCRLALFIPTFLGREIIGCSENVNHKYVYPLSKKNYRYTFLFKSNPEKNSCLYNFLCWSTKCISNYLSAHLKNYIVYDQMF